MDQKLRDRRRLRVLEHRHQPAQLDAIRMRLDFLRLGRKLIGHPGVFHPIAVGIGVMDRHVRVGDGGLFQVLIDRRPAALEARFDAIACSMTEFHYGRFDLRFETVEALMRAEDFSIVEINGIGGEAIDCWDPRLAVTEVYRRLTEQQRLLFMIGQRNRARGFRPTGFADFVTSFFRQSQLIRRYPASA